MNNNLTDEQKKILFEKGTEAPFSGKYVDSKEAGTFTCVNCGAALFSSDTKFDSGTGWPSFDRVLSNDAIKRTHDVSHGMSRIEISCKNCGAHLGHVFPDGPTETGERFCINSACLDLKK